METKINDNVKLGVIGCGKMAGAILGGVFKNGFLNPENIIIYDKNDEASRKLSSEYGFIKKNSMEELLNCSNVLFLAVKPFVADEVLAQIKENRNFELIISILAGVKIEKYRSYLKNAKIIRVMPNTPALVNEGASALCASENVTECEWNFACNFMKNCGKVIKTTEDKIDAITALSGSGPAFYFRIIDLMAKSAQKIGLDYRQALLLSAQTALGSAKMVFENNFDIEQLIKNVTTKGGCTEIGNNVLNESDMDKILDKVIKDTARKASELG